MAQSRTKKEFYIEFGKIVYAMAMADGAVQEEEKAALYRLVRDELSTVENYSDEYGTDLAYYTLFSFELEGEVFNTVSEASKSFMNYLSMNKTKPDEKLKKACLNILKKVARSYGRVTQEEKAILDQVSKTLGGN